MTRKATPKATGFRVVPYALEVELRALPPAQRAVLLSLVFLAKWEPGDVDVDGHRVRLDAGEALVSGRGLARDLRLGEGAKGYMIARRALASGVRIGLITTRAAVPKGDAPPDAPRDAPPTIVRFNRHRAILWPGHKGDAPPDAQGDAIPVVQQSNRTSKEACAEPPALAPTAMVSLPCKGSEDFDVTPAKVDEWSTAFPGVNVLAELHKARAWCAANEAKRKTRRGMPRFLVSWLARADRAKDGPNGNGAAKPGMRPAGASDGRHKLPEEQFT